MFAIARYRRAALAGISLLSCASFDRAWAEEVSPDIVVVADKREISLQKAPVSVSAIPGDALDRQRIVTALDLNGQVPGLSVTQSESFQRLVSIRGVGYSTPQNQIAQSGVAFHIDGVYIVGNTALLQDFFDVERLDILRGPQGTVYGQNAQGGTINVLTKRPDLSGFSGHVDLAAGNYGLVNPRIAVNLPLSSTLALRVAGTHLRRDGYTKSTLLNRFDLDDANQSSVRGELLWQPNDDFSALLSTQYVRVNQADNALKNILDSEPDPRRVTQDYEGRFRSTQLVQSLTLKKEFDWGAISSISSYQYLKYFKSHDNDRLDFAHYTPHDIMPYSGQKTDSWTQEINIASAPGGPIDWIVGGFFLDTRASGYVIEYYTLPGEPMPYLDGSYFPRNLGYQSTSTPSRTSYSVFGQGTAHLGDRTRLTLGLRYTRDKAFSDNSSYFGPITHVSKRSNVLTGKVGIDFDLTDRNLLYATITRGFKPAGSNLSTRPVLGALTFDKETVWAYEVGSKNRFLNDDLTVNAAAFYYDYSDYQFSQDDPVPYQGGISNVPKARIYGAEIEAQAKLPANFVFDGNVTFLNGEVRSNSLALDTTTANAVTAEYAARGYGSFAPQTIAARLAAATNINGKTLPFLSGFAFKAGLSREFATGFGPLKASVDYRYQSAFQTRIFNDPNLDRVKGYGLLNGSVGLRSQDGKWSFDLIATNLLGSDAEATRFTNTFGFGTTSVSYVAPRQVLGRVGLTF